MPEDRVYDSDKVQQRTEFFSHSHVVQETNLERFFGLIGVLTPFCGRVLDIGTGNSYVLKQLSRRFPERRFVYYGIDCNRQMLMSDTPSIDESVRLIQGDNRLIPCKSASLNSVTAKNVTNFSPSEVYRVLQKPGYFFLREYGIGKGLVEIAHMFPNRLIRARHPSFYEDGLRHSGFSNIRVEKFTVKRNYTLKDLLTIVTMFPFVEQFSSDDADKIRELYHGQPSLEVTADPFIIVAEK